MSIDHARRRRAAKAAALATLETRQVTLMQTLREPPTALKTVSLYQVLLATPGLGERGATRLCKENSIWPLSPLIALTPAMIDTIEANLPKRVVDASK